MKRNRKIFNATENEYESFKQKTNKGRTKLNGVKQGRPVRINNTPNITPSTVRLTTSTSQPNGSSSSSSSVSNNNDNNNHKNKTQAFLDLIPIKSKPKLKSKLSPKSKNSNTNVFKVIKVPGDGDCFYHAVMEAMKAQYPNFYDIILKERNSKSLRKSLEKHILNDESLQQYMGKKLNKVLERIEKGGYAQDYEIVAMQSLLSSRLQKGFNNPNMNICIRVKDSSPMVSTHKQHNMQVFNGSLLGRSGQCDMTIFLRKTGTGNGEHFDAMYKKTV